jgi:hypothetical protein
VDIFIRLGPNNNIYLDFVGAGLVTSAEFTDLDEFRAFAAECEDVIERLGKAEIPKVFLEGWEEAQ